MNKMLQIQHYGILCSLIIFGSIINSHAGECDGTVRYIQLSADQEIIFFPTLAYHDEEQGYFIIGIHAWVFEPERDSVKRKIFKNIVKNDLGISDDDARKKIFDYRAGLLLVDQEGKKDIAVGIGQGQFCVGKTDRNGHVETVVKIPVQSSAYLIQKDSLGRYLIIGANTTGTGNRIISVKVRVIDSKGIMLVSDIDDTIKISNVRDKKELIENSFCREFRPVPGMASLYRILAAKGVVVHYLTASPWQLYPAISEFIVHEGFPRGIFQMKYFGFSKNLRNLFAPSEQVKVPYLNELIKRYPRYRFILIGDSGERDPEIYGEFARIHRQRVMGVFIRNVTGEKKDSARMQKAFHGVSSEFWLLFDNPDEIARDILRRLK